MIPSTSRSQPRWPEEALAWGSGPLRPRIAAGEVHVWRAQLDRVGDRNDLLSEAERERERRIVNEREQRLWRRSRSVLRLLLGRYLDAAPERVPLVLDAGGKPRLGPPQEDPGAGAGAPSLHFNLSHSGALALYVLSCSWPVGIDVELAHTEGRPRDHVALTRRVFGEDEARRMHALAPGAREGELLRLWTRYEAALKRVGRGIGGGVDAGVSGVEPSGVEEPAWIVELDVGVDGAAALAGQRAPSALRVWDFR